MRGLGFTFARCQPVFAGRSEFSPERETELGDVCQDFAIVHDSHVLQGSTCQEMHVCRASSELLL